MLTVTPVQAGSNGGRVVSMFGKNALVVDDSLTARTVLKHQLNQFDVVVESAPDGNHALKMLRSNTPDVIFLDHVMPGLDGFQVLERLKADNATRRIPVVMYTSQAAPQYIREAKVLGAVAVIPKDVTDEQLADALNKAEVYQLSAANDDVHTTRQNRDTERTADRAEPANLRPVHPEARYVPAGLEAAPVEDETTARSQMASAEDAGRVSADTSRAPGNWLVPLLLTVLVFSHIHMLWRDREHQQLIGELRQVIAMGDHRIADIYQKLAVQRDQLNETSSRQVELIMTLLLDRAGEANVVDTADVEEDSAFDEHGTFDEYGVFHRDAAVDEKSAPEMQ